jgi:peptidoglycan/xylan/chitin deacetylase (PgdA/CDA1 family)
MAGEDRPGEEKLDVAPERLASHLRLLRRLRFTTLGPERQLTFHADGDEPLPARSVVLTVDDGFRDCAGPLLAHAGHRPQLFVPTHELGGSGHWLAGEPLLDWPEVVRLESGGVRVGAHARRHRPLDSLDERTRRAELEGSRRDLEDRVTQPLPLLSYPSGRHDTSVRGAAAQAGFAAAYTTEKGRNGAGTDPYCLRRVSVYGYDGTPALAWKALTGQAVPALWERRRISRIRRGSPRPRGTILRTHPPAGVLVSVVMPAFAPRRDWLLQAVESVLGERGCAIELVVVDDGSPDPVADMLATIADSRLRIVRTEHGGTSRARNAGVTAARGDYVRFVDSDDVVEPGGTAHLLGMIAGEHDRIAYGATLICDEQLEPVRLMRCRLDGSIASSCLLDEVEVRIFSMLFPRAVLEATGKWEPALRVCQDWDYALRAFEHARVRGDERVVTRYRRHAAGASADMDACLLGERLVVARYFGRHPEHRGTSLERRARARLERTAARTHRGGRWRFARAMGRALALAPLDTARELARDAAGAARGAARAAYKLIAAAPAPAGPARRPS